MTDRAYIVQCCWDPEAEVWVATSEEVPGLATGGDTLDALIQKLKVVIPELLEANGIIAPDQIEDIPFIVMAERHELAPRAA
jgi:predicted RNase H-like HicB family nuclease